MNSFDRRAARLVQRIAFDTTMHCRLDILSPRENDDHLFARMLDELDAFIDHGGCAASRSRSQLPDGLRSVRYSMSPLIQKKLDKAGCLGAHQYRLMPTTETEMIDFIEEDCPIPRAEWPTLERIGHVSPDTYARWIFALHDTNPHVVRLILSRNFDLAFAKDWRLSATPPNDCGFTGRLIDVCVAFAELEFCHGLGRGLFQSQVTTHEVLSLLTCHTRALDEMRCRSAAGEYLIGLLVNPQTLRKALQGGGAYGLGSVTQINGYDPIADLADKNRFEAFARDVQSSAPFVPAPNEKREAAGKKGRVVNAEVATFWGLDLKQLADAAIHAFADLLPTHRGEGLGPHPTLQGKGDRAAAIRTMSSCFYATVTGGSVPKAVSTNASGLQNSRDACQLMAPQIGKPGGTSMIGGLNWLNKSSSRALWEALCAKPPSPQWLKANVACPGALEAFAALEEIRSLAPQLFSPDGRQHAHLLAELATATGWLSGQPQFSERVRTLVEHAPQLRNAGWLKDSTKGRFGGGGDWRRRK